VREWIIEDSALAKIMKRQGLSVQIADGRKLFGVDIDADWQGIWRRWTKMLFALLDFRLIKLFLMLIFVNSVMLMPLLQALVVAGMWLAGVAHPWFTQLALLAAIQLVFVVTWFLRIAGHYRGLAGWCLASLPASALFTSAAFVYS